MRPRGQASELEKRRRQAVARVLGSESAGQVAKAVGVRLRSVRRWLHAYRKDGLPGLGAQPITGRPAKLTPAQRAKLGRMLLRGPQANGFDRYDWDTRDIWKLIKRESNVNCSIDDVSYWLPRCTGMGFYKLNKARPWDGGRLRVARYD